MHQLAVPDLEILLSSLSFSLYLNKITAGRKAGGILV
jgi:hypothetical protein